MGVFRSARASALPRTISSRLTGGPPCGPLKQNWVLKVPKDQICHGHKDARRQQVNTTFPVPP